MSLTTWFLRKAFKRSDDKRDAGLTTPPDIERRDNIPPNLENRVLCAPSRPVAVAPFREQRLIDERQYLGDCLLYDSVFDARYPQLPHSPIRLPSDSASRRTPLPSAVSFPLPGGFGSFTL